MELDPRASRVTIDLFAHGFLSALAHDLRIEARELRGSITSETTAEVVAPVASLAVIGTLKRGSFDSSGLSPSDRSEVERRIREDHLRGSEVKVTAQLSGSSATLLFKAPRGEQSVRTTVTITRKEGSVQVDGRCELSLKALGVGEIRGPAGVFKLKDEANAQFSVVFRAP